MLRDLSTHHQRLFMGDALSEPMKEDHPLNNTNFYGATKVAFVEQIIRSYYHRNFRKFEYVGLRYMNVYGLRQDSKGAYVAVIMKILENLKKDKEPVVYGDGKQSYDFINVKDCALANHTSYEVKFLRSILLISEQELKNFNSWN